jgi:hypothetical protein
LNLDFSVTLYFHPKPDGLLWWTRVPGLNTAEVPIASIKQEAFLHYGRALRALQGCRWFHNASEA